MLDLTRPVRFKGGTMKLYYIGKMRDGRSVLEQGEWPRVVLACEEDIENIPEPKVIEQIMAVYKNNEGDFFFSEWVPGCIFQKIKITYTEGAENPWQIEEGK